MWHTVKYLSFGSMSAIIGIISFMIIGNIISKRNEHTCRWRECPYIGVTKHDWHTAVSQYTGEVLTDAYKIDMLHLQYPTLNADQLDSLLTTIN